MDNKNYTQELMKQLSLLRDLLIVIERGGDKTPDVLYTLAIEKSQQITSMVQARRDEMHPATVTIPDDYPLWLDDEIHHDISDISACNEENTGSEHQHLEENNGGCEEFCQECNNTQLNGNEDNCDDDPDKEDTHILIADDDIIPVEKECIDTTEEAEQPALNETPAFVPDSEEIQSQHPKDDVIDMSTDEIDTIPVDDTNTESKPTEAAIDTPDEEITMSDNSIELVDEYIEEDDIEIVDEEEYEVAEVAEPEDYRYNRGQSSKDEEDVVMTIGDKLSLNRAKELRKALSFNERFRYRRELFGNKDVEMNNTLNLIDAMSDYAEACEYLLQDLGWSAEEPVVQEFLELVERHFKQQ